MPARPAGTVLTNDPIYENTRVVVDIDLYDPRSGSPFPAVAPTVRGERPDGTSTDPVDMTENPVDSGHYEADFLVDIDGEWTSWVEIPAPRESAFARKFYVSPR